MKKLLARGTVLVLLLSLLLAAFPSLALAETITAVEENCYIRTAPGLSGEIIYTVPVGESAIYLGETSVDDRGVTWYKATYNGVTGWMSGLQISLDSVANFGTVTAVTEDCFIRTAPGLSGEILYTVPEGESATFLGDTSVDNRGVTWYRAAYKGIIGWMSGLQVRVNPRVISIETVTAVEEHCYIRTAPGLSGEILYTVPVGESAIYLGETSVDNRGVTWYLATYNGVIGWMSGLQISKNF